MNWRRRLDGLASWLLLGCLVGLPIYLMSEGYSFWDAALSTLMGLGFLGATIFMIGAFVGTPVGMIMKSIAKPRPPQKQGRIWAWLLIGGGCASVVWGHEVNDGGKLALGLVAMVFGAGILTGAWEDRN